VRILQSLIFYPRGGSAHVARAIAREAQRGGHEIQTVTGSLGRPGDATHAATFYAGVPLHTMDYEPALRDFEAGRDPMRSSQPFHPSYEPRGDVPDRLFASVSPELTRHSEKAWAELYRTVAVGFEPDVIHLHHLTPQMIAVKNVFPEKRVVAHLHGTELKMLDLIDSKPDIDERLLQYAEFWHDYIVEAARCADRLVVVSGSDRHHASRLLGVSEELITVIPNGVDTEIFAPVQQEDVEQRNQVFRRSLVDDPRGSDESGEIGSISYENADLERSGLLEHNAVILGYVGRFTEVKRVPLLLDAFARLSKKHSQCVLVLFGGFPGEWEGEHPAAIVRRTEQKNVYFAGWHTQQELAEVMPRLDVLVLPSVNESFGLVLVEAMASGTAVVAVDRGGPSSIIVSSGPDANGWLVEPDNALALESALAEAVSNPLGRRLKGVAGRRRAIEKYSWTSSFDRVIDVYQSLAIPVSVLE